MNYYNTIIFDLDGTLWETKESYLASYHYLINKYPHIDNHLSDDDVLKTMGDTLDVVGQALFHTVSTHEQLQLMSEALKHSCQYLKQQPSTIYPHLINTLAFLAKTTSLFIVSNCPKEYLEVFFEVSKTSDFITDYRFLTAETTKRQNINELIDQYQLTNILMVGDSFDDYQAIKDQQQIDFAYASYGYKKTNYYDYYLNNLNDLKDIITFVNYRKNILDHIKDYQILSYFDASVVLMANPNQRDSDYLFGFWRFSQNTAHNEQLFTILESHIPKHKTLAGPIDYCTWFKYLLALDEYDWHIYPDLLNTAESVSFLFNRGYRLQYSYVSTLSTIDEKLWQLSRKHRHDDYHVKVIKGNAVYQYLNQLHDISCDCFRSGYYYLPISFDTFENIYLQAFKNITPELVLIYDNQHAIAFSFCYKDPYQNFYIAKTAGIKRHYQQQRVILMLIDESYKLMRDGKHQYVIYHFQNEQKNILSRMWKNNVLKQKHYGIFIKEF